MKCFSCDGTGYQSSCEQKYIGCGGYETVSVRSNIPCTLCDGTGAITYVRTDVTRKAGYYDCWKCSGNGYTDTQKVAKSWYASGVPIEYELKYITCSVCKGKKQVWSEEAQRDIYTPDRTVYTRETDKRNTAHASSGCLILVSAGLLLTAMTAVSAFLFVLCDQIP